jgi:hypothetical protein
MSEKLSLGLYKEIVYSRIALCFAEINFNSFNGFK